MLEMRSPRHQSRNRLDHLELGKKVINGPGDVPTTQPNGATCPEFPYMAKAKRDRPAAKNEAKTRRLPKNSTAQKGGNVRTEDTTDPNVGMQDTLRNA